MKMQWVIFNCHPFIHVLVILRHAIFNGHNAHIRFTRKQVLILGDFWAAPENRHLQKRGFSPRRFFFYQDLTWNSLLRKKLADGSQENGKNGVRLMGQFLRGQRVEVIFFGGHLGHENVVHITWFSKKNLAKKFGDPFLAGNWSQVLKKGTHIFAASFVLFFVKHSQCVLRGYYSRWSISPRQNSQNTCQNDRKLILKKKDRFWYNKKMVASVIFRAGAVRSSRTTFSRPFNVWVGVRCHLGKNFVVGSFILPHIFQCISDWNKNQRHLMKVRKNTTENGLRSLLKMHTRFIPGLLLTMLPQEGNNVTERS